MNTPAKETLPPEFDADECDKELNRQGFTHNYSFLAGRYMARWQHARDKAHYAAKLTAAENENARLKDYKDFIFDYAHENILPENAGRHIADALVREHRQMKWDLTLSNQKVTELEEALKTSEFLHHKAVDALDRIDRGDDYRDATKFEIAWHDSQKEIESLKAEVQCLRSVLSEWDQDKSCYVQMNRADEIASKRQSCARGEGEKNG